MDAGRVGGIFGGQFGMEGGRAFCGQAGREGGGDGRVDGRDLGDAVQQGLEIQAGAAHQQGHMALASTALAAATAWPAQRPAPIFRSVGRKPYR